MLNKYCILIGGGKSINEGIELGLWDKIKDKDNWSLNFAYKVMPYLPKREVFVDTIFFNNNSLALAQLHQKGVVIHAKAHSRYNFITEIQQHYTTRNKVEYYGTKALEKKVIYIGRMGMCGHFALSLAIAEGYNTIFLCFSEDTEVFTNEGWKYFKDLRGDELILTRKYDGNTEWSKINKKIEYEYDGFLNHIKSRGIDLLVTDEHKFGLINKNKNQYTWKSVKDFNKNISYFIPRTFIWEGVEEKYFYLPKLERNKHDHVSKLINKIDMKDWLRFLGLYLSEGCTSINKGNYKVTIYQNHTIKKDKYIKSILNKLPIKYHWHERGWVFYSKQIVYYLKQFGKCYQKYIPKEFLSLKKEYLLVLLESLIFGDGSIDKDETISYYSTSKQLIDDIQEIGFKCGYYASIYTSNKLKISSLCSSKRKSWSISMNKSTKRGNISKISVCNLLMRNNIKKTYYKGKVYDINVNNHTLWVRRNNVCCWSGNCGFDFGTVKPDDHFTHFYQKQIQVNSSGVGCPDVYWKNGQLKNELEDFDVYLKEDSYKIFNVSPNSNIYQFEKITYPQFFEKINEKSD